MSICCGADHDTRFCPECGTRLRKWDLSSLVTHLEAKLKFQEGAMEKAQAKLAGLQEAGADVTESAYRKAVMGHKSRERLVERYRGWLDSVRNAVAV